MAKSRKELPAEGQKNLENAVEAAFQFLSTMTEGLCNSAVWSKPEASRSYYAPRKPRRRFRAALASVRATLNAIPHSHLEIVGGAAAASKEDEALVKKLEEQASNMRMVICKA